MSGIVMPSMKRETLPSGRTAALLVCGLVGLCGPLSATTVDLRDSTDDTLTVKALAEGTDYTNSGDALKTLAVELDADTTYAGTLSGKLRVTVSVPAKTVTLTGDNTFTGGLDILQGTVAVARPEALGTGTVTLSNGATHLMLNAGMTVTNELVLGDYTKANYTSGLRVKGGCRVTLTAPLTYQNSWITANDKATLTLAGGLVQAAGTSGGTFICEALGGEVAFTTTPLALESDGQVLQLQGSGWTSFAVADNRVAKIRFKEVGGLRLDSADAFANAPALDLPYDSRGVTRNGGRLDLNGHSQAFGNIFLTPGDLQNETVLVNSSETPATFTFTQNATDVAKACLRLEGALSFVKKGAKTFGVTNATFSVACTLDVAEGTLAVAPTEGARLADVVVIRRGAVLDLGDRTVSCGTFSNLGGTVRNGTLKFERTGYFADAGEEVEVVVDDDLAVYYPFRSAATLAHDFSGQRNEDLLCVGAPVFCTEGRFGGGVSFDGASSFTNRPDVFPASLPSGNAPFTLLAHVKGAGEAVNAQALLTLGSAVRSQNNVLQAASNKDLRHFFWGDDDGFRRPLANGATFDDGAWHAVAASGDGKGNHALWSDGVCLTNGPIVWKDGMPSTPNVAKTAFMIAGCFAYQNPFKGQMDEVAVMRRALTEEEMAAYATGGIAAIVRAEGVRLAAADGARLHVAAGVSADAVTGPGEISTFGLTVTGTLVDAPALVGDLVLASGTTLVHTRGRSVTVAGDVTVAGTGTLQVDSDWSVPLRVPATETVLTASGRLSAAAWTSWTIEGVPSRYKAALLVDGPDLKLKLLGTGCTIIVR